MDMKVFNFKPTLQESEHLALAYRDEPSLKELVKKYYCAHFEESQAIELTQKYFEALAEQY